MEDLIIDIETAGTAPDAKIISIGAVFIDRRTGIMGNEFYDKMDSEYGANSVRTTDSSTMRWWEKVAPVEAKDEAWSGEEDLETTLKRFKEWVRANCSLNKVRPWGNGSVFDMILLENAYRQIEVPPPWKFYNIRDVRTVLDMASVNKKTALSFEGIEHHALWDAKHEASLVLLALKKLQKAGFSW